MAWDFQTLAAQEPEQVEERRIDVTGAAGLMVGGSHGRQAMPCGK